MNGYQSLMAGALCAAASAAVVENVTVNTAGAPTNYVVTYNLNVPSGEWYYVDAVLSAALTKSKIENRKSKIVNRKSPSVCIREN